VIVTFFGGDSCRTCDGMGTAVHARLDVRRYTVSSVSSYALK